MNQNKTDGKEFNSRFKISNIFMKGKSLTIIVTMSYAVKIINRVIFCQISKCSIYGIPKETRLFITTFLKDGREIRDGKTAPHFELDINMSNCLTPLELRNYIVFEIKCFNFNLNIYKIEIHNKMITNDEYK